MHLRITDKEDTMNQIVSIEEAKVHGTAELRTDRLVLRRYRPEDADALYRHLGSDLAMYNTPAGIPTLHLRCHRKP